MKSDFSKYSKASSEVRAVFRDYDPDLDAASLDEAYMDVTDYCKAHQKSGVLKLQPDTSVYHRHRSSHKIFASCKQLKESLSAEQPIKILVAKVFLWYPFSSTFCRG